MALTTPLPKPVDERPPGPFQRVVKFCCQPQPGLDALGRRRSRILAAFLFVSVAVFGFVDSVYVLNQPQPAIRIGWRSEPEEPVFFVSDNGVGIDPAHHERVFGLFDKLNPRTEGTGVGLALARRIVEVHGGRTWIESAGQGHGTTVCFTLPGPPSAAE